MVENKHDGWFPEGINILPTPKEALKALGGFVTRLCSQMVHEGISDHQRPHGASELLDHQLYEQLEIPYKAMYETYDDGAAHPSTYDSLFYPDETR